MTRTLRQFCHLFFFVGPLILTTGCWDREPQSNVSYDLNLFSGIRGVVSLGDSETQMLQRSALSHNKEGLGDQKGGFQFVYQFKSIGTTVYFRNGRVVLIELQEPFRGEIQGKKLRVFTLEPPAGKTWEDALLRQLGEPTARASGGKFGSEALFYSWGDVSYNRNGPNQIAIYREGELARFRQKNFGRDLKLFPN